uniref:ATP synthase protein MI25 n=1 Tax=Isoetes engelmannii TaxID=37427 RepID=C6G4A4_ISOEN|nr:ATP synthase F0 subunit b [Isoetes engelmannii]
MNNKFFVFAVVISVLSLKMIFNEESLVALSLVVFVIFGEFTLGGTFKATLDARSETILSELERLMGSTEEAKSILDINQSRTECLLLNTASLRFNFRLLDMVEGPKYKETVQAVLCQGMELKFETLLAMKEHSHIRFQDEVVTCSRFVVGDEFRFSKLRKAQSTLVRQSMVLLKDGAKMQAILGRGEEIGKTSKV